MPAVREDSRRLRRNENLVTESEWNARREEARERSYDDEEEELTDEELAELDVTSWARELLATAVKARQPYEVFDKCWDLFRGVMLPPGLPRWRGKIILNKLRQIVLFLQGAMTDNPPRINMQPAIPGTEKAANLMGKLVDRAWDRTDAQAAHSMAAFYGLLFGTGVVKWGMEHTPGNGRPRPFCEAVVPYRLFFNPGATCVADAEYLIQVERKSLGWVKRHFPTKYDKVKKHAGSSGGSGSRGLDDAANQRDLVQEGYPDAANTYAIHTAMSMDGHSVRVPRNTKQLSREDHQMVDIYEFWARDDASEEYERQKVRNGIGVVEPVKNEDGGYVMEPTGQSQIVVNPFTGQPMILPQLRVKMKKVMVKSERPKYPNGRTVMMAGPVLLRDIPNPYEIDGFPYADWRNVDVGCVWGEGEPLALKDGNIGMIRSISMLYDNLNLGGQLSWLVNKQSGLSPEQIKNRPAAIYPVDGDPKAAMAAVERPQISGEFLALYNTLDKALPALSGLNDAILGGAPPANTAFATMDSLTEQGAVSIRLRVRNWEKMLTRSGRILSGLIQQFDNGEDPLRIQKDPEPRFEYGEPDENGEREIIAVVQPARNVEAEWDFYTKAMIQGRIELSITPDSTLSTSPAGLFNKLMTLLDKHVVDQQYVVEKLNLEDGDAVLKRMQAAMMLQAQMKKKPGPKPGAAAKKEARPPAAPTRHVPTTAENAAVR